LSSGRNWPDETNYCFLRFFFILIFLIGCQAPHPDLRILPLPETAELVNRIDQNYDKLISFEGHGLVRLTSPELKAVHGIAIYFKKPDLLRLEVKGVLGLQVGTLIVKDNRYYLETMAQPGIYTGNMDEPISDPNIQIGLTGQQLLDLMIPLFKLPVEMDHVEVSKDFRVESLKIEQDNPVENYAAWLDYSDPILLKDIYVDSYGDTAQYRSFDDYKLDADLYFPQAWSVQLGADEDRFLVEVDLAKVKINQNLSPLLFTPDF